MTTLLPTMIHPSLAAADLRRPDIGEGDLGAGLDLGHASLHEENPAFTIWIPGLCMMRGRVRPLKSSRARFSKALD
jgi:hypothetical protein